jgi:disulfide oxidoreductase YuzD
VERRFGDAASVMYRDASVEEVRVAHLPVLDRIRDDGLVFPVTFVDGEPVYDGAVSHAVILRNVQSRLEAPRAAE